MCIMPATTETVPVEDSVAKVGNEIAVGEDIEFQRRWWRFEKGVWVVFLVIVLLDLAGAFGRGPLANAHARTPGGTMVIDYEHTERFSTPSIMTIHFAPSAVQDGKIQLWVSDTVVKELGNQRIVPEPVSSVIGNGGILYTFASTPLPDSIAFALQPARPGITHFELRMPGATLNGPPRDTFKARVVVMP
jgi:hypothetical protein